MYAIAAIFKSLWVISSAERDELYFSSVAKHVQTTHTQTDTDARCPEQLPFDAPFGTNCPKAVWVDDMVQKDPSPGKIIMDVGCNKGDDAIAWMERWGSDQELFWSKGRWVEALKHRGANNFACGEPTTNVARAIQNITLGPTVVCVEPMAANARLLREVSAQLGYDQSGTHGSFHLVEAALSDKAVPGQTVEFHDAEAGSETGHISSILQTTPLKTVDSLAEELKLPRIDVLTIDTEGWDPSVIYGATSTLQHVRYLEFEVHRDFTSSPWGSTSLKSVVDHLDKLRFICYWAGNDAHLLNIKMCWSDQFERGTWANVVCVKSGDPWEKVLEAFVAS